MNATLAIRVAAKMTWNSRTGIGALRILATPAGSNTAGGEPAMSAKYQKRGP
jgi:hypothetical protein